MHSKAIKLAAAAAIVIAVLLGLQFVGTSGVTFAQAIQPILNANTAILDIVIGAEDPNTPVIHDMVTGSRIRRTVGGIEGDISVIDLQTGRILSLTPAKKEAVYIDLKGLPQIPDYLDNLKNLFGELQGSPHFEIRDLGPRQIDGHEAIGFLARHPRAEITLWADAATGLPIRIEQKEPQVLTIIRNIQFDVPMDDALFSMEVPEGYQQQQMELDLFGSTEADFIEGLRILAETFGDGQFPDGVSLEDHLKQAPALEKQFGELPLSSEERIALGTKISKYVLFMRFFQGEGKWYYRGKGVRLGQAEIPIFWYRPRGSTTYRVIYGDLRVEDAVPDQLPEPLDADDIPAADIGYQPWSRPEFVGKQEDFWQIQAGERVTVQSDLTLMKGPEGVSAMPITLPYATGVLTSVSLAGLPVEFRLTGPGRYELQLPREALQAGQTKITCTWTLPLADLEAADFGRRVLLRTLIPVVSLRIKAGVDADSGYEVIEPMKSLMAPSRPWALIFTWEGAEPKTDCGGTCGITIRRRP